MTATFVNRATATVSWPGRVLSTLVVAFIVFDGVLHIAKPAPVVEAFSQLGYPLRLSVGLGVLELVFTILYAIPRTAFIGALLLTAYLGGAIATQLRVDAGWFPMIFPVIVAALLWTGLALRDARVRGLIGDR
ncbi:MAG TPA: DoxX family protein [Gemmatimonadaceae bacterium]|nr:DoxX family protein [Gemmatimonadaceae bacterium]